MANKHPANFGDVLKHLILCEVISLARPRRYLESHAGAFEYEFADVESGIGGVWDFIDLANRHEALGSSRYADVLASFAGNEAASRTYPGSIAQAHLLLHPDVEILAADNHKGTASDLNSALMAAGRRGGAVWTDGIDFVDSAGGSGDLILLDPYDPLEPSPRGTTSLDLFGRLAERGAIVVLWYAINSTSSPNLRLDLLDAHAEGARDFWRGEAELARPSAGIHGCGVMAANLPTGGVGRLSHRFEKLAELLFSGERLQGWRMWPASPANATTRWWWTHGFIANRAPTAAIISAMLEDCGYPLILVDRSLDNDVGPIRREDIRIEPDGAAIRVDVQERGKHRTLWITEISDDGTLITREGEEFAPIQHMAGTGEVMFEGAEHLLEDAYEEEEEEE